MSDVPKKPAKSARPRKSNVRDRIEDAQRRLTLAIAAVARASRRRLAAIFAKPVREWVYHANDEQLSPQDQRRVQDRVAQLLPKPQRRSFNDWSGSLSLRRAVRLVRRWGVIGAVGAVVSALGLAIKLNTATVVTFTQPTEVVFQWPNGGQLGRFYAVGDHGQVVHRVPWKRQLRHWVEGQGYAYADLPDDVTR